MQINKRSRYCSGKKPETTTHTFLRAFLPATYKLGGMDAGIVLIAELGATYLGQLRDFFLFLGDLNEN